MRLWRYARAFRAAGHELRVLTDAGPNSMTTHVEVDGVRLAGERLDFGEVVYRNNRVTLALPGGQRLEVEAGYNSWWTVGQAARLDGALVWESHPGRPIALTGLAGRMMTGQSGSSGQMARLKTQWPSVAADIAIGLLFFVVAKLADLRTAALVAAGAGLALVVVQRFVKVDLLGGLALFGIVMTLLGAGFAILFEDDRMIQLRSTVLGGIAALLFLIDGAAGGRYLGKRMALYMPQSGLDSARLSLGFGLSGLVLALLNLALVELATKDQWLFYTSFVDTPVAIAGLLLTLQFAKVGPAAA